MENTRKLDLRLLIGLLAIFSVAMTIWAATAFAGGSSSSGSEEPATSPAAAFIQEEGETPEEEDGLPLPGDCPERDGEEGDSGSSDTSSSDLQ